MEQGDSVRVEGLPTREVKLTARRAARRAREERRKAYTKSLETSLWIAITQSEHYKAVCRHLLDRIQNDDRDQSELLLDFENYLLGSLNAPYTRDTMYAIAPTAPLMGLVADVNVLDAAGSSPLWQYPEPVQAIVRQWWDERRVFDEQRIRFGEMIEHKERVLLDEQITKKAILIGLEYVQDDFHLTDLHSRLKALLDDPLGVANSRRKQKLCLSSDPDPVSVDDSDVVPLPLDKL